MRLIDADALAEDLLYDAELCAIALDSLEIADSKELARLQFEKDCKQNCVYYISESPTVDAVEVVRCGECKHREEKTFWCEKVQDFISNPEWFCADGERKGGDERLLD